MAHDVFISYSHKDQAVADAVCATLEGRGIRCWIAARDVAPSDTWAKAIVRAIDDSTVFVLIFSANANTSPQVLREVDRAATRGIPILPFRVEDVKPTDGMAFFVNSLHWLDALTPPLQAHIDRLAENVQKLLPASRLSAQLPVTAPTTPSPGLPPRRVWRLEIRLAIVLGACAVLLVAMQGAYSSLLARRSFATPTQTALPTAVQARVSPTAPPIPSATSTQAPTRAPTVIPAAALATSVSAPTPAPTPPMLTPTRLPTQPPSTSTSVPTATSLRTTTQTSTSGPIPVVTRLPIQTFTLPVAGPIDVMYDGASLKVLYEGQLVRVELVEAEGRFRQVDQQKGFDRAFSVALDAQGKRYWTVRGGFYSVQRGIDLRDMAGAVIASYEMPEAFTGDPRHIAWDGESIWVSAVRGGIYKMKVDPQRQVLVVLDSYAPAVNRMAGVDIDGMTWAGDYLWVASLGMLSKLDRSLRLVCKLDFSVDRDPVSWMRMLGVAWDGTYVWIGSHDANLLFRIDPAACK